LIALQDEYRARLDNLPTSLQELGGSGEAGFLVVPVAQIDDILVWAELQGAGIELDQLDKASGFGKWFSRNETMAPLRRLRAFRPGRAGMRAWSQ
jgi:hypothetical protein